ncbi:MAG: PPC domain-containing protein [Planctomycetales bacterium]|nr:PPC domain-containing protein [Planctomycetales bacterium]
MTVDTPFRTMLALCGLSLWMCVGRDTFGQVPTPVLETIFPAGCQAGQAVDVTVTGANLTGRITLICNVSGFHSEPMKPDLFHLTIPLGTPPGRYELRAVSDNGVSPPRTFCIGNRAELVETDPNTSLSTAVSVPLNHVINGRIDAAGDIDYFRFEAQEGQRVVVECWAERIDSRLRAVVELYDAEGRRLAVNRGYFGIDPLIDFSVPSDGSYFVKVQDLIATGSVEHYYRLDIDTGPRVAFSVPNVVQRGKESRVAFYGWNLGGMRDRSTTKDQADFDRVEVDIPGSLAQGTWPWPVRQHPSQAVLDGFAYHLPRSHASIVIGVTDVPVVLDGGQNHSPTSAQLISHPCEVSGQLVAGDERDWYAIQTQRGEVLYFDVFAQRIQSPVDLQVGLFDASGQHELVQFGDEIRNNGGKILPTNHLDPVGRWVVPADGRYLIEVRNLIGGLPTDSRRTYRLCVRREEPDFQVVAVSRRDDPSGLNVRRGGREVLDVLAFRQRGLEGPIRISAKDLPQGMECPDVWIGSGVERATVVLSADDNASERFGELKLEAFAEGVGHRTVRGGAIVRTGTPNGWGTLTSQIPFAVTGDAALRITANGHETLQHPLYGKLDVRHSPGGILDVAVQIERRDPKFQAPVKLMAAGLPDSIRNQTVVIPAGEQQGSLSFYLPAHLAVGRYSIVIRAETMLPTADSKTESVTIYSNPVVFDVRPAAFLLEIDPFAPTRVRRGEVIVVGYSSLRRNGFIGKMHTELAAPGRVTNVVGLRGRGETFIGQTDRGSLQVIINDDAPLGKVPFLRLLTVGILEDEPIFQGSSFFNLEIVD